MSITATTKTLPQTLPICDTNKIYQEWDRVSVQKNWAEKVHAWMSFDSAPVYGKKQNSLELAGTCLLIPCALWFGSFLIKQPKDVDMLTLTLQKVSAVFLLILTSPITILGALIKGLGELLPHETMECDDKTKKPSHPLLAQASYLMAEKFTKACAEFGFDRFYPIDGTLLGAVRHGGFIPWDDDVDLGFDESDREQLIEKLKPRLEAQGIVWADNVYKNFSVFKLSFGQEEWSKLIENVKKTNPEEPIPQEWIDHAPNIIDLCGTKIMSDGTWASSSAATRTMFPTDYVPLQDATEIEKPRQFIRYGSTLLPTFSNETIIKFLKTYYGDDCLKYGVQTHSHGSVNTPWGRFPLPKFHPTYRFKITPRA